ncbi:hypothetical protein L1887_55776 [Cichorium endivia]|nr:hypothetical protein L1887_55776 [Cichorium endivia]
MGDGRLPRSFLAITAHGFALAMRHGRQHITAPRTGCACRLLEPVVSLADPDSALATSRLGSEGAGCRPLDLYLKPGLLPFCHGVEASSNPTPSPLDTASLLVSSVPRLPPLPTRPITTVCTDQSIGARHSCTRRSSVARTSAQRDIFVSRLEPEIPRQRINRSTDADDTLAVDVDAGLGPRACTPRIKRTSSRPGFNALFTNRSRARSLARPWQFRNRSHRTFSAGRSHKSLAKMPDIDNPVSPVPVHIEERKSPGSPHSPSATHSRHPHHHSPSSQGSTPSPSNLSHPASLNGDDARHGTSPATSVDVPSVPPAGLKLDTASHYAQTRREQQASLSRAGVARSPHPLDGTFTGRSGGMLATMQEEGGPSFADSRRDSSLGFDSNQTFSQMEQAMRASRHRSASSAAALALHGSSGPYVDPLGQQRPQAGSRPRPTCRPVRYGTEQGREKPRADPMRRTAWLPRGLSHTLQRGFSASYVRNKPEPASPSPFLSSPAGFHDLGFDFTEGSLRTHRSNYNTNSSPFGAVHDLPELSSYPEPTRLGGADADGLDGDDDRAQSGLRVATATRWPVPRLPDAIQPAPV